MRDRPAHRFNVPGGTAPERQRASTEGAHRPGDAEAMAVYASASNEVLEAAVTLCRTIGDLSRERLVSVLLASMPKED